jgi:hypothetical protein
MNVKASIHNIRLSLNYNVHENSVRLSSITNPKVHMYIKAYNFILLLLAIHTPIYFSSSLEVSAKGEGASYINPTTTASTTPYGSCGTGANRGFPL